MSSLFNPDYLQHLCLKYGLRPSKKYGQNFLIDKEVIDKIILAANLQPSDTVVEVGPGFGVLTIALSKAVKKVVAFEIEKKLQPYWEKTIPDLQIKNVQIVWGNVLKQIDSLKSKVESPYQLVANLPYQITSPVIRTFLESDNPPSAMVLMVQKEVAERICAAPGQMSLLSVAVQYYADAKIIFAVPRTCFWPVPRVDSAVIRLSLRGARNERRSNPQSIKKAFSKIQEIATVAPLPRNDTVKQGIASSADANRPPRDDTLLFKLVKAGFAQKRKLLIKNLVPIVGKKNKDELLKIFSRLALAPTARAQELSVEKWRELAKNMAPFSGQ